jgi:hypothetical protein
MNFPAFDDRLPFLNQFILELVDAYQAGKINTWDTLDKNVKKFFTAERMEQTESVVPNWKKMSIFLDGITLTHVMCVFLGMYMEPEYLRLTREQQEKMKWVILFHDVEKQPQAGKRDHAHAFRSAVGAARTLPRLGFTITPEYNALINEWDQFTRSAITKLESSSDDVQDNSKFPTILDGIERMFGNNTPATLIIKTILFHLSVDMQPWPPVTPLTDEEVRRYFDRDLVLLLRVMNLGDGLGWNMFEEFRDSLQIGTLEAFKKVEQLILK